MNQSFRFGCVLAALAMSAPSIAEIYVYEIQSMTAVDLGTFGGDEAEARDVNDAGEVVGWARMSLGIPHAFLHRDGAMQDITGSLGLFPAYANGINKYSEVVGSYNNVSDTYAFYWNQTTEEVMTLHEPEYAGSSVARAISDNGTIVGDLWTDWYPNDEHSICYGPTPVRWQHALANIEKLFCPHAGITPYRAENVNASGRIVGVQGFPDVEGWSWQGGVKTVVPQPDDVSCNETAFGVNDSGAVVGRSMDCSDPDYPYRAFFWNGFAATSVLLGTFPGGKVSEAREINNQKMSVGYSQALVHMGGYALLLRDRAFLHHAHFGMKALPLPPGFPPSSTSCRANAVSHRMRTGALYAVGYCTLAGKMRAIRWDLNVRMVALPPTPPVQGP